MNGKETIERRCSGTLQTLLFQRIALTRLGFTCLRLGVGLKSALQIEHDSSYGTLLMMPVYRRSNSQADTTRHR